MTTQEEQQASPATPMTDDEKFQVVLDRLDELQKDVQSVRDNLARMRRFMVYRVIFLIVVVVLPVLALPYFLSTFVTSYVGVFDQLL
jgi:hypothetical protein